MLVASGACSSDDDASGAAPAASATSTTSTTAGITAGEQRTSAASTSTTTVPSGERGDGWPEPVAAVRHGDTYWAVYLAVVRGRDGNAPKLVEATRQAAAVGYETGAGDVACDTGAKEALSLDPSQVYTGVAIYFATESGARTFVDLYEPGVVGIASVETLCAD